MAESENKILLTVNVVDNFAEAQKRIDQLKEKLKTVKSEVTNLEKEQQKLNKQWQDGNISIEEYGKQQAKLTEKLSKSTKAESEQRVELKLASEELKKVEKTLENAIVAEDVLATSTKNVGKSLGDLKQDLEGLKNSSFDGLSPEKINTVKQSIADLQGQISDMEEELKALEPGEAFNQLSSGFKTVSDGVGLLSGMLQSMGVESEFLSQLESNLTTLSNTMQTLGTITEFVAEKKYLLIAASIKSSLSSTTEAIARQQAALAAKKEAAGDTMSATAKIGHTVATSALTAAQWLLNAATSAFPVLLIIAAIAAVASLFGWFSSSSDAVEDAAESQEKYNQVAQETSDKIDDINRQLKAKTDRMKADSRANIQQMQEDGKSKEEIAQAELESIENIANAEKEASKEREALQANQLAAAADNLTLQEKALASLEQGSDEYEEQAAKIRENQLEVEKLKTSIAGEQTLRINIDVDTADAKSKAADEKDKEAEKQRKKAQDRALKNLDTQKKAALSSLELQKTYQKDDLAGKQEYEKKVFDTEEKFEKDKLEAQLRFNRISIDEYNATLNQLSIERKLFEKGQVDEVAAFWDSRRKEIAGMVRQSLEEEVAAMNDSYEQAVEDLNKINSKLDPGNKNDFEKIEANELLITKLKAEQADKQKEYAENIEDQKIAEINKKVDDDYKDQLAKHGSNEIEKLKVERESLEKKIADKNAAGVSAAEDEAALAANTIQLLEANASRELAMVRNNAGEELRIKRQLVQDKMAELEKQMGAEAAASKEYQELKKEEAAIDTQKAEQDKEDFDERLAKLQEYAEQAQQAMGSLNEIFSNMEAGKLEEAEERNAQEKEDLKAKLDANLLTQEEYDKKVAESDNNLEKEKAEIARKQAIREKAMAIFDIGVNTALGIIKAVAASPTTGGLPFTAIVAALGALQLGAVISKPIPKAARGGLIGGRSHALGGTLIEAEAGEAIINRRSTGAFAPLLSAINQLGGGVPFAATASDGGFAQREYSRQNQPTLSVDDMRTAMREAVGEVKIYTAIEDINEGSKRYSEITDTSVF